MLHRRLSRLAAAIAACLILFLSLPVSNNASAEGNIIRAAEGGATSGSCGADWANPCDLQYALITVAHQGDEIWVKAGMYYPTSNPTDRNASFSLRGGINVYGGFAGTETDRSQRDWVVNPTILSGDIDHNDLASPAETADQVVGGNSLHVVYAYDLLVDVYMDGFTITAGLGSSTEGGGVLLSVSGNNPPFPGTAHLSNVHIMGSRALIGGGVYFNHTGTLTDALVSGCAADQEGGGIGIHGEPTLTRVTISGSTADRGGGMGITYSSPILTDLTFAGNTASHQGGGLYANYADPAITGAVFQDNFAGTEGGGAYFSNAKPVITGSTFENNRTNENGGGAYNDYSVLTLRDSLMVGNSAVNGGGMYSFETIADLTNVTITGNTASGEGGGLYLDGGTADNAQVMKHVTIAYNTSANGGGLYVTGAKPSEIYNSIVWGNQGPNYTNQIVGTVTASSSLIQNGYTGGLNIRTSGAYLGLLSDVGGRVRVHPLLPGSSAIDFSNAAYCPEADARGVARPQGAGCDAGAYESRPFQVTVLAGDGQSTPVYRFFPQPLEVSVTSAYGEPVDGGQLSVSYLAEKFKYGTSVLTISSGKVSVWARAGSTEGAHTVWFLPSPITIPGDPGTAAFNLTNTPSVPAVFRVALTTRSGLCGDRWDRPCTLEQALAFSIPGDEIWVKAGTYRSATEKPIDLPNGLAIYGGFAGVETTREAREWQANPTILSADWDRNDLANPISDLSQIMGNNSVSVLSMQNCGPFTLDGFTITGARSRGGIRMRNCVATLRNLLIQGNISNEGGGLYAEDTTLQISNVTFRYNSASQEGGGSHTQGYKDLQFENVTYESNTAGTRGGGAFVYGRDVQIKGVTFIDNTAGHSGGGLHIDVHGETRLEGGLFLRNQAATGGGLSLDHAEESLQVQNMTFTENSASTYGGAMVLERYQNYYGCAIRHLTMVGNESPSGGAIYLASGNYRMCGSILWNNTPDQIFRYSGSLSVYDSIVQDGYPGGANILTADPLLAPLGDYGGGTQTFALLPGSPAIDAGQENYCPETDQRGVTRPQGAGCDMGAFESRGFTLSIAGGDSQSTGLTQAFANPLAVTVSSASNEPVVGGLVTFTPPAQGASASIGGSPAGINGSGRASVTAQANETGGAYSVSAGGPGIQPVSFHLTNLPAAATIEASIDKTPVVHGETLSFRALVQSNVGTPTGKVQFRLDGVDLGAPVDLMGGVAVLSCDQIVPVGMHQLTAAYLGSESHLAALTENPVELTVQQANTSLAISSSANPGVLGQTITLTATVSPVSPGRGMPTGEVIFTIDGGPEIAVLLVEGEAIMALPVLAAGSHTITAAYVGDVNFSASPTASFTQWVQNPIPTITALNPGAVFEDSPGFTLIITGTGFVYGAVIHWNGIELPSEVMDSTTIKVAVSAELLENPGESQITVSNPAPGGDETSTAVFTVLERMRLYLPLVFGQ